MVLVASLVLNEAKSGIGNLPDESLGTKRALLLPIDCCGGVTSTIHLIGRRKRE